MSVKFKFHLEKRGERPTIDRLALLANEVAMRAQYCHLSGLTFKSRLGFIVPLIS